jgi:hypothetical protein
MASIGNAANSFGMVIWRLRREIGNDELKKYDSAIGIYSLQKGQTSISVCNGSRLRRLSIEGPENKANISNLTDLPQRSCHDS